jgi:predicted molibdopterin-dependent oxidoreductase YjgC
MASPNMRMAETDSSKGGALRVAGTIGAVIALGVIAFVVWSYVRNSRMTSQAEKVASTFVRSSPKVAQNLGTVVSVKETSEARVSSPLSGWKVDMDVTGRKAKGIVDMTLQNVDGEWNVPQATLDQANGKPVNLM